MSKADKEKLLTPNSVLIARRGRQSRAKLALELQKICEELHRRSSSPFFQTPSREAIEKQIYRLERGEIKNPDELYRKLYCLRYKVSPQELFGNLTRQVEPQSPTFRLRNHKLIPVFVGADLAEQAIVNMRMQAPSDQWTPCYHCQLDHPSEGVDSDLWIWPFGVALFHVVEDVEFPNLASLAVWHRRVYDEQMAWVNEMAGSLLGSSARGQYAMPVNWIVRPIWSGSDLITAMEVLSMPRILLQRTADTDASDLAHAELVERALFRDGFDHADVAEFGVKGISVGVASWSGVVYCPIAPKRALSESEVIACELTVQAVWSYCDWLRSEVEAGNDPNVRSEHGWRLLHALRSVVTNPRPEESPQMYPMRTAILQTSGITEHLKQAAETLLELKG